MGILLLSFFIAVAVLLFLFIKGTRILISELFESEKNLTERDRLDGIADEDGWSKKTKSSPKFYRLIKGTIFFFFPLLVFSYSLYSFLTIDQTMKESLTDRQMRHVAKAVSWIHSSVKEFYKQNKQYPTVAELKDGISLEIYNAINSKEKKNTSEYNHHIIYYFPNINSNTREITQISIIAQEAIFYDIGDCVLYQSTEDGVINVAEIRKLYPELRKNQLVPIFSSFISVRDLPEAFKPLSKRKIKPVIF